MTTNPCLMLCESCLSYYWTESTGNPEEWRVILATGETVKRIMPIENTIQDGVDYALGTRTEPVWQIGEYIPIQIQASPDPLCHNPLCAVSEKLVETYVILP